MRKIKKIFFYCTFLIGNACLVYADLPTGGNVAAGTAIIDNSAAGNGVLNINQSSNKAVINWNNYNVGTGQRVNYNLPGSGAITLNRVTGGNASQILGSIVSNGQFWLINPNGIMFGQNAQINVAGLLASTLNITDENFLNGNYSFAKDGSGVAKEIVNAGNITALNGGYVALLAPRITNSGVIIANTGKIVLAGGTQATVTLDQNSLLSFAVTANQNDSVSIINTGKLQADGGDVLLMTPHDVDTLLDNSINVEGIVQANTANNRQGKIVFSSGGVTQVNNATLTASGENTGEVGGTIQILGNEVGLIGYTTIDASGKAGGGTVLIGGDYQGNNPEVQNSTFTYFGENTKVNANALDSGNGGRVIVWADDNTLFLGKINAVGSGNGNGGFIETSGKSALHVADAADANPGGGGTWLLDPGTITIGSSGTDFSTLVSEDAGWLQYQTVNDMTISASSIANRIMAGSSSGGSLTVQILGGNIVVSAPITFSRSGNAPYGTLYLAANYDLTLSGDITVTGGTLNLNLSAGSIIDSTAAGTLTIASNISLNGGSLTLQNDKGAITQTGGAITNLSSSAGLNLYAKGAVNLTSAGNQFSFVNTSAVDKKVGSLNLVNSNAGGLTLGLITASNGDINITNSTGAITTSGNLTASGNINLTNTTTGLTTSQTAITLNNNLNSKQLALSAKTGKINQGAGAITTTGMLTVNAPGSVTLNQSGNDFSTVTGGNVSLGGLTLNDKSGITLSTITSSGSVNVTTNGLITVSGYLDATGKSITLTNNSTDSASGGIILQNTLYTTNLTLTSSSGDIIEDPGVGRRIFANGLLTLNAPGNILFETISNNGSQIQIGDSIVPSLVKFNDLSGFTILSLKSNGPVTLTANNVPPNGQAITVSGPIDVGNNTLSLIDNSTDPSSGLVLNGNITAGDLILTTNQGVISQTGGTIISTGTLKLNALGLVTLNQQANDFSTVTSGTSSLGGLTLSDINGITLGAITATGNIVVNSNVSGSGTDALIINGAIFAYGGTPAKNVTFINNSTNSNSGGILLSANVQANNLTLTSIQGNITQNAGRVRTNLLTLNTPGRVQLEATNNNADNLVIGSTIAPSAGISFADLDGFTVNSITSQGPISLTANVNMMGNTLPLVVNGPIHAGSNTVSLFNASTNISDQGITLNGNITAGNLNLITTQGNISQSAGIIISTGTLTLNAAGLVSLNQSGNDFGTVMGQANGLTLNDVNALTFGTLTLGAGNFALTTNNSAITQSGAITQTGSDTVTINSGSGDITLANADNDFAGVINMNGGTVTLSSKNGLNLGNVTAGDLSLTTPQGGIAQAANTAIISTGMLTLNAPGAITLNQANDFTKVTGGDVTALGGLTLTDINRITVQGINSQGNVSITANTVTSNDDMLLVNGPINASGATVTLNNQSSNSSGQGGEILLNSNVAADTLNLSSNGMISQTDGVITANKLFIVTSDYVALMQDNNINQLYGNVGSDINIKNAATSGLILGDTAQGGLTVGGKTFIQTAGTLSFANTSSSAPLVSSISGSNTAVVLVADNISNTYTGGSAPIQTASDSNWQIYLTDTSGINSVFGAGSNTLASNNYAIWNTDYTDLNALNTLLANTSAGNHYIFAYQPILTLSSGTYATTKVYGDMTSLMSPISSNFNASYLDASEYNNAFLQDSASNINLDNSGLNYSSAGVSVTANAGQYDIYLNGSASASSGYLVSYDNNESFGTLSVTPRPITVTADNANRYYGDMNPDFSGTVTGGQGLANNDSLSSVVNYLTSAGSGSNAGDYAITPNSINSNYFLTANNGTLTVSPRPITVKADNASQVYGENNPAFSYQVTSGNVVNGDVLDVSYSTSVTNTTGVGSYALSTSGSNSNYDVTYQSGTLTVTPRPITVTANNASKYSGEANPVFTSSITGGSLANNDIITSSIISAEATSDSAAGAYPINISNIMIGSDGTDISGNYDITYVNGQLTVLPKPGPSRGIPVFSSSTNPEIIVNEILQNSVQQDKEENCKGSSTNEQGTCN